jgi:hypothetical protein
MIVFRAYATAKRGQLREAIDFLKAASADVSETFRIYSPYIGDNDMLGYEVEFEDLAHYERWNKEYINNPEAQENLKGWFDLTTGLRSEILTLE